jgi:hypothetical protein
MGFFNQITEFFRKRPKIDVKEMQAIHERNAANLRAQTAATSQLRYYNANGQPTLTRPEVPARPKNDFRELLRANKIWKSLSQLRATDNAMVSASSGVQMQGQQARQQPRKSLGRGGPGN